MFSGKLDSVFRKTVVFPLGRMRGNRFNGLTTNYSEDDMGGAVYSNPQYHIEKMRGLGDTHSLKNAFTESFMKDEPFLKMLGLTGREAKGELMDIMMNEFSYEDSLVARSNSTDEILGFALNGRFDHDKYAEDMAIKIKSLQDPRNKKVVNFMLALSRTFNHKCVRPLCSSMEIFYLGVIPKARRQGIAKELVNQSLVLAKCKDYGVLQVVCTSHKSAQICESLGMTKACDVHYEDLIMEDDGRPIAVKTPPYPDDIIKIYYFIT